MKEITIIVKDSEKTMRIKELCYEPLIMDDQHPYLKSLIEKAVLAFASQPESIVVKVNMVVE